MLRGNIVTTCGITSIKHNPGDQRQPISAAKLQDDKMKVKRAAWIFLLVDPDISGYFGIFWSKQLLHFSSLQSTRVAGGLQLLQGAGETGEGKAENVS